MRLLSKGNISSIYRLSIHDVVYISFVILITGSISDRIGRRRMIQILTIGLFIIAIITQSLLQFLDLSIQTK